MLEFKISNEPQPEVHWTEECRVARHGLPTEHHIITIEMCDGEREYEIEHPIKCHDSGCEFTDFESASVGDVPPGRWFIEVHFWQDYWGEWDAETVIHGSVDA